MKIVQFLSCLFLVMLLMSCQDKYPVTAEQNNTQALASSCVDCHLDAEMLKSVAIPLPPDTSGSSGES